MEPGNGVGDFSTGKASEQTCGCYPDEVSACAAFDQAAEACGLFRIYREVSGFYTYRAPFKEYGEPRIDRVLIPTSNLEAAGWSSGAIGVEIKRSGVKLGPVLSQMLDYSHATWRLTAAGVKVSLDFIFLFPFGRLGNNLGSICEQNRLGQACLQYPPHSEHYRLQFFSGEHAQIVYYFNRPKAERLTVNQKPAGRKVGSR